MKVLKVEAGKTPEVVTIDGKLESLQEAVEGFIEVLYPFNEEVGLICNEEGKLNGLPLNRAIYDEKKELVDVIAGSFLVVGAPSNSEDFASLTEEQLTRYEKIFHSPEMFVEVNHNIFAIPTI